MKNRCYLPKHSIYSYSICDSEKYQIIIKIKKVNQGAHFFNMNNRKAQSSKSPNGPNPSGLTQYKYQYHFQAISSKPSLATLAPPSSVFSPRAKLDTHTYIHLYLHTKQETATTLSFISPFTYKRQVTQKSWPFHSILVISSSLCSFFFCVFMGCVLMITL